MFYCLFINLATCCILLLGSGDLGGELQASVYSTDEQMQLSGGQEECALPQLTPNHTPELVRVSQDRLEGTCLIHPSSPPPPPHTHTHLTLRLFYSLDLQQYICFFSYFLWNQNVICFIFETKMRA